MIKFLSKQINKIFISVTIFIQASMLAILFGMDIDKKVSDTLVTSCILGVITIITLCLSLLYSKVFLHLKCKNSYAYKNVQSYMSFSLIVFGMLCALWFMMSLAFPYDGFSKIEKYKGRVIRTNDRILIETKNRTIESFRKEDYELKNPVLCVEQRYNSFKSRGSDSYFICDINFNEGKK